MKWKIVWTTIYPLNSFSNNSLGITFNEIYFDVLHQEERTKKSAIH